MADPWAHGAVAYPLTALTDNSLLEDADPALFHALAFLSATIRIDVGDRLRAEAALPPHNLVIDDAVASTLHIDPLPVLAANQFTFPLFALFRREEGEIEQTMTLRSDAAVWGFAYVLPSLTPAQQIALQPILRSVARSLTRYVRKGSHPDYESGRRVFYEAGIQQAKIGPITYGGYAPIDETGESGFFRAITGTIEVLERDMPVSSAITTPFAGANLNIDIRDPDDTVSVDVTTARTQQPPTLVSISPSTGSKAGGTPVAVTGTLFRAPARLAFGGIEVPAVVVNATTITAVTPEHAAYPTFAADLIIVNGDGQAARLAEAFTYTTP